jgi:hypothetical protein
MSAGLIERRTISSTTSLGSGAARLQTLMAAVAADAGYFQGVTGG